MTYTWYKVINRSEFLATGLVSRSLTLVLEGVGAKDFLVTVGNYFSITVDDVMLSVGMAGQNPFYFGSVGIILDVNDDVWYGIGVDED